MAFSANLGGWIADTLVSKGLSVTTVRKVSQNCLIGYTIMCNIFFFFRNHNPFSAFLFIACHGLYLSDRLPTNRGMNAPY